MFEVEPIGEKEAAKTRAPTGFGLTVTEGMVGDREHRDVEGYGGEGGVETVMKNVDENGISGKAEGSKEGEDATMEGGAGQVGTGEKVIVGFGKIAGWAERVFERTAAMKNVAGRKKTVGQLDEE